MITSISVSSDSTLLLIQLSDGQSVSLSAEYLRVNARDAESRREQLEHGKITASANIKISEIRQVGHTGLNISFSDGNNRAIFPYRYLQSLAGTFTDNQLTTS